MKKNPWVLSLLVLGIIFGSILECGAQEAKKGACFDVDGTVWMHSTDAAKRSFLLGVKNKIILNSHIRTILSRA